MMTLAVARKMTIQMIPAVAKRTTTQTVMVKTRVRRHGMMQSTDTNAGGKKMKTL